MNIKNIFNKVLSYLFSVDYARTIIDISFWQCSQDDSKLFDFDVYEESDGIFVIVKASQGTSVDRRFLYYVTELIKRLLGFGAYHFADTRCSARKSARLFAEQVNELEKNQIPGIKSGKEITKYWLDVERAGCCTTSKYYNRTWIRSFLDEFKKSTDAKIGIYTSYYGWTDHVATMKEIHELDLWQADYDSVPTPPKDWSDYGKTWLIWQQCASCTACGSCGKDYGAASVSIDTNVFNGTIDEFYDWLLDEGEDELSSKEYEELKAMILNNEEDIASNTNRIEVLEGETNPPVFDTRMVCNADPSLRIRSEPETGTTIGGIPYGAIVYVSDQKVPDSQGRGDWVYLKYNEYIGWSAGWYLSDFF